jgi:hypothetical protein
MRTRLLSLFVLICSQTIAQNEAPKITWAYLLDGYNTTDLNDLDIDSSGNTYVSVHSTSYINIKELKLKTKHPGHVGSTILKLSPEGKPLWATEINGSRTGWVRHISLAKNGDLLVSGHADGETHYGSTKGKGINAGMKKPSGQFHNPQFAFLARYSPEGKLRWVKEIGGFGFGLDVEERSDGTLLWSVVYRKHITDNGTIIDKMESDHHSMYRFRILKVSEEGELTSMHPFWNENTREGHHYHSRMYLDQEDNLYIYGRFGEEVRITDQDVITHNYSKEGEDAYLIKFDSNDKYTWNKRVGGLGWQWIKALTVDKKGRVYVTGTYGHECSIADGITFDHQTEHKWKSGSNFFYCRFSPEGELQFANFSRQEGYASSTTPLAIELDHNQRTHIVGTFTDTLDFEGRIAPLYGTRHNGTNFYSRWKEDSLEVLNSPISNGQKNIGWASPMEIRMKGKHAVVAGIYWNQPQINDVNGKKMKFTEWEHGRSTFVYGFTVPKMDENEEEEDPLKDINPVLACLPPKLLTQPNIWVPIDTLIQNEEVVTPTESCGVIREGASAMLVPNPTRGKTKLVLEGLQGHAKIQVFDMQGKLLLAQEIVLAGEGAQSYDFDFTSVAKGTYIIQVIHEDYQKVLRLVKNG